MTYLLGLYGSGGCGRGLMPLLRDNFSNHPVRIVFIDDNAKSGSSINSIEVLTWSAFLKSSATKRSVCLGVADPRVRSTLARKCDTSGISVSGIIAPNVVIMDNVEIGEGACISPFVTLTSNIVIGRAFHANLYSYVEHDCVIGDYVTFAPGAKCNGNVTIGDFAYIGAGAIIRQGLTIGAGAVVGMGAAVTKDVPEGVTVVGNPARLLEYK